MPDPPDVIDVGDQVALGRRRTPNRVALQSLPEGRALTYAELDDRTDRIANGLRALGLMRHDRIACWAATNLAYAELYVAAAKAKLVIVPVNERYTPDEARAILDDADPRAIAFDHTTVTRLDALGLGNDLVRVDLAEPTTRRGIALESLLAAQPDAATVSGAADDPFILGYTSGTTGRPKGAVLTRRSVLAINRSNAVAYHLVAGSVGLFTGSMSFTATVPANLLTHLFVGGTTILTGTRDPGEVVRVIRDHRANYLAVPPPMVADYAETFALHRPSITSLVSVLQSAGPARPGELARLNDALDGRLILGWGMTENSGGLATSTSPREMWTARAGDDPLLASVGQAVPGTSVELIDANGAVLPSDGTTVAELAITGPALMAGYWRMPEATAAALTDGRYRTGDVGRIDPDGTVTILDRRTDLIVSGGMNVYPSEIEAVLRTVPGVAACAVVGIPHDRWGRAVAAAIEVEPGRSLAEHEVLAHCRDRLASYKKPVAVAFVEQLPRTLGDKVHRPSVAALFEAGIGDATRKDEQ